MFNIKMYFDGNKNPSGTSCTYRLICGDKTKEQTAELPEDTTVPQAEYMGLIRGLDAVKKPEDTAIEIYGDSQLIVYQVSKKYECKDTELRILRSEVYTLLEKFKSWTINWIPREQNLAG